MKLDLCPVCKEGYSGGYCFSCSLDDKIAHHANVKATSNEAVIDPPAKQYSHYLTVLDYFNLDQAVKALGVTFHFNVYLVGSVLTKPNFRDVDLRCMLDDEDYDKLFKSQYKDLNGEHMLKMMNITISAWLKSVTGLPVDFQIQKTSEANKEYHKQKRSCIGWVIQGQL